MQSVPEVGPRSRSPKSGGGEAEGGMKSGGGTGTRGRVRHACRPAAGLAAAILALVGTAACSGSATSNGGAAILDRGKISSILVGRSSRANVFAVLGRPSRTERSAAGEAWVYEARESDAAGRQNVISGVASAAGVVGAVVPYAGLVGSGLGLAGAAVGKSRHDSTVTSLAVAFGPDGVVRDCVYTSTAVPAGFLGRGRTPRWWTAVGLSRALPRCPERDSADA
jgi:outer membrane protein assembly factor BamE (lipoprotein component of BamABCDE complex)